MNMCGVEIKAVAAKVPTLAVKNEDPQWFSKISSTDREEWEQKWGIKQRYYTDLSVSMPMDISVSVAQEALQLAELDSDDIDLFITSSSLAVQIPERQFYPRISHTLKQRLQLKNATAEFDIQNECSSMMDGLQLAANAIMTGQAEHVLILTQEISSAIMDRSCVNGMNFGDGYAAMVVSKSSDPTLGIVSQHYQSFPKHHKLATICWNDKVDTYFGLCFDMPEQGARVMGQFVPKSLPKLVNAAMKKVELDSNDIDFFVFHQPARKLIDAWCALLRIPEHKVLKIMEEFGCAVAAAMPLAFNIALQQQAIADNSKIVIASPSIGWGFGAQIWQLGKVPKFSSNVHYQI
ncbi:3-oxoacyl-ACP synthase III family protein [Pseudoalteromonas galatheae]|uniref:3-oxoacyl-ACP synthase III family protein n=1 Tax=Pseudoalteromonas galatheae TaxID=579562 RepID=UPI0030D152C2